MSNALAIAAVTATLRNLLTQGIQLEPELVDTTVTTMLPDRARSSSDTANQVNLFLYQAIPNAAWRNMDDPTRTRPGETGFAPLALNLKYLLTAYGRDNDQSEPFSHELLGRSMSILHDHPVLGAAEIEAALPRNDLFAQIERIRFTLQPLDVEDIYRLWTGFQTPYRTSVAYEASVVLISSSRMTSAPLPVLTRGRPSAFGGRVDGGAIVVPDVVPPTIATVVPSASVSFGASLQLVGTNLTGDSASVSIASPTLQTPIVIAATIDPVGGSVAFTLPAAAPSIAVGNATEAFPAGLYSVAVTVTRAGLDFSSNALPLAIGPSVTKGLPADLSVANPKLSLECTPPIEANQRVSLLLGGTEILAAPFDTPATAVSFDLTPLPVGSYFARLRVDGADSPLVADMTAKPPVFDPNARIAIQ